MSVSRHPEGSLGAALDAAARTLTDAGVESARLDARLLVAHALGREPAFCMAYPETALTAGDCHAIESLVDRRRRFEPMAHILGEREFWSLPFAVTKDTLVPRPDTEAVIEAVLAMLPKENGPASLSFLDLGTGTGCILISLLTEYPRATGLGVDINPGAVEVAAKNADTLSVASRARFAVGNWFDGIDGPFDVIISNPPYIPTGDWDSLAPDVRDFDPPAALFAGVDGLDAYRDLAADVPRMLRDDGFLVLEIGAGQEVDVSALMSKAGLVPVHSQNDLAGRPRALVFRRNGE